MRYQYKIEKFRLFNALGIEPREFSDNAGVEAHASEQGSAGSGLFDIRKFNQKGQGFIHFEDKGSADTQLPIIILCTNPLSLPRVQHTDYQLLNALFYYGFTVKIWQNKPYHKIKAINNLDEVSAKHHHSQYYYTSQDVRIALQAQYIANNPIIIDSDQWHDIKKKFLEVEANCYRILAQGSEIDISEYKKQLDGSFYLDAKDLGSYQPAFSMARKLTVHVFKNSGLKFDPEKFPALETLHIVTKDEITCVNICIMKMPKLKQFYACNIKGARLIVKNNTLLETIQLEEENSLQNSFINIQLEKLPALKEAYLLVANNNIRYVIKNCRLLRHAALVMNEHNHTLIKQLYPSLDYLCSRQNPNNTAERIQSIIAANSLNEMGKKSSAFTLSKIMAYDKIQQKNFCEMTIYLNNFDFSGFIQKPKESMSSYLLTIKNLTLIIDADRNMASEQVNRLFMEGLPIENLEINMSTSKLSSPLNIRINIPELISFRYNMGKHDNSIIKQKEFDPSPLFDLENCPNLKEIAINSPKINLKLPSSVQYLELQDGKEFLKLCNIAQCTNIVFLDIKHLLCWNQYSLADIVDINVLKNIKYLSINDNFPVADQYLQEIKKNLISLSILSFTSSERHQVTDFKHFIHYPHIKRVLLSF